MYIHIFRYFHSTYITPKKKPLEKIKSHEASFIIESIRDAQVTQFLL